MNTKQRYTAYALFFGPLLILPIVVILIPPMQPLSEVVPSEQYTFYVPFVKPKPQTPAFTITTLFNAHSLNLLFLYLQLIKTKAGPTSATMTLNHLCQPRPLGIKCLLTDLCFYTKGSKPTSDQQNDFQSSPHQPHHLPVPQTQDAV